MSGIEATLREEKDFIREALELSAKARESSGKRKLQEAIASLSQSYGKIIPFPSSGQDLDTLSFIENSYGIARETLRSGRDATPEIERYEWAVRKYAQKNGIK